MLALLAALLAVAAVSAAPAPHSLWDSVQPVQQSGSSGPKPSQPTAPLGSSGGYPVQPPCPPSQPPSPPVQPPSPPVQPPCPPGQSSSPPASSGSPDGGHGLLGVQLPDLNGATDGLAGKVINVYAAGLASAWAVMPQDIKASTMDAFTHAWGNADPVDYADPSSAPAHGALGLVQVKDLNTPTGGLGGKGLDAAAGIVGKVWSVMPQDIKGSSIDTFAKYSGTTRSSPSQGW